MSLATECFQGEHLLRSSEYICCCLLEFFFPPSLLCGPAASASLGSSLEMQMWDFPGGPVVKNTLCNAGDVGSIPGWGTKNPHAVELLSPRTRTTVSMCYREDPIQSNK